MNIDFDKLKEKISGALLNTGRPGISNLVTFLDESDFFKAPASTMFHLDFEGGLALHSFFVYKLLKEKVKEYDLGTKYDTVAIAGLCHDLCKVNFYKRVMKWRKDQNNQWEQYRAWEVEDTFPTGHGEKSVFVLNKFIQLTDEEIIAIRWHMVAFDPGIHFNYPSGFPFRKAIKETPLATLLFTADFESSGVVEGDNKLIKKHASEVLMPSADK